ncbi:MAG: hypothetical protein LBF67_06410 [Prevotellaceae bacterium]|jgi:hypothetical protein|nr:hypothetical protein [Prevotellaceae bacterium]
MKVLKSFQQAKRCELLIANKCKSKLEKLLLTLLGGGGGGGGGEWR